MDKKEIKKEAEKILKNLDFEAVKINKDNDGYSVLLKDKNSSFCCWFDIWEYMEELYGNWNEYIFDLNNYDDLLKEYIQKNENAFENAFDVSIEAIENEL